jgi:hypothetical protein
MIFLNTGKLGLQSEGIAGVFNIYAESGRGTENITQVKE